ncbi:MAG: tRNA lysidine(34) synthetase TilS [Balneolaceae bacterium]|nr:tRNA lysidine(34) synthetase TilS [Balneolaceae bacterium]MCH8548381.1 tRNA lysidine(34) synthetase TilS [Balneolaceae bacterium]
MSRSESLSIIKEFRKSLQVPAKGTERKVLGVSGGVDSMVLLYLMKIHWQNVVAVHCNYGLRGKASDEDQNFVEEICRDLFNVECVSVRFDPSDLKNGNTQKLAREKRYQVFEDLKRELQADLIVTAHHRDDQVETIFQKIIRGSGLRTWSGMEVLDGDLFRPLLNVSKEEILDFARKENIPYREDMTNRESDYARNFIRNEWAPELNRLFPGWKENLLKAGERAAEFEELADHLLSGLIDTDGSLERQSFINLSDKLQRVALVRWLEKSGYESVAGTGFLSEVEKINSLQSGGRLQAGIGCYILRDRDRFVITDEDTGDDAQAEVVVNSPEELPIISDHFKISAERFSGKVSDGGLSLDLDKVKFPITISAWSEGDRFTPLGMEGSQSVADHLTNRKISSATKGETQVIKSFDGSIRAVIFPRNSSDLQTGTISETAKCDQGTQTILRIRKI